MARTFVDALPPEGIYKSREALLAAVNSWVKSRGYAFTIGKSTNNPEWTGQGGVRV